MQVVYDVTRTIFWLWFCGIFIDVDSNCILQAERPQSVAVFCTDTAQGFDENATMEMRILLRCGVVKTERAEGYSSGG